MGGQQCRPPGHFTGDSLDGSEHGPGLDVLLGAMFSGLARACWPSPGEITEAGKFAKLDSSLQGSTHPVHKRSGPMIDFEIGHVDRISEYLFAATPRRYQFTLSGALSG